MCRTWQPLLLDFSANHKTLVFQPIIMETSGEDTVPAEPGKISFPIH